MSRVGKYPVDVPNGVTVSVAGDSVSAKGKLGTLSYKLASQVEALMPALNRLCDQALANPQIAALAKPAIDALRVRLQMLAQA